MRIGKDRFTDEFILAWSVLYPWQQEAILLLAKQEMEKKGITGITPLTYIRQKIEGDSP